jgi:hypothetical protein
MKTSLLVVLAKIQYTREGEPTISRIKQDKNLDNDVYYVCIEFSNLFLLTVVCKNIEDSNCIFFGTPCLTPYKS